MSDGWILVQTYISLGSGNDSNGYTWVDTIHIDVAIKQTGLDALDKELNKSSEAKLQDSIMESNISHIETNKSVQETNEATKRLYKEVLPETFTAQNKAANWSLGLAFLSVAFIGISAYLQYQDKTPSVVKGLQQELKETRQVLQDMKLSLEKISSSMKPHDTIYVKVKK